MKSPEILNLLRDLFFGGITIIGFSVAGFSLFQLAHIAFGGGITGSRGGDASRVVTVNESKLTNAIYYGKDSDGKTKEDYFFDFKPGNTVIVVNSFVYGRDTSSSDSWSINIGDNTPRVTYRQKTDDAKRIAMNLTKRLVDATVTGIFNSIIGDVVYLDNCTIEGVS